MRSALIFATCALAILAAPTPEADPMYNAPRRSVALGFRANRKREAPLRARSPAPAPCGRRSCSRDTISSEEDSVEAPWPTQAFSGRYSHSYDTNDGIENVEVRSAASGKNSNLQEGQGINVVDQPSGYSRPAQRRRYASPDVDDEREDGHKTKDIAGIEKQTPSLSGPVDKENHSEEQGEQDVEAQALWNKSDTKRDAEPEPVVRPNKDQKRAKENIEARAFRTKGDTKRDAEPEPVVRPNKGTKRAKENIEARAFRTKGDTKRDAEPEPVVRPNKDQKRAKENIEARAFRTKGDTKRDAEPEPVVRPNKGTKRAKEDAEQASGDLLNGRAAETDPSPRKHDSYRRYAEAGITRGDGSYRRSAEPEPAVTHGGADAGYRSQTCHPGLISSRC